MSAQSLIHRELNKLESFPGWGRRQGNDWDRLSNFIYRVKVLDGLRRQARAMAQAAGLDEASFTAYAIRRWYNYHTHQAILDFILTHPTIRPERDPRHPTIDFYLRELPFDLKLSRFPRAYPASLESVLIRPVELVNWQYRNQSRQGRHHSGNRLFLILHDVRRPTETWQLRRHFPQLKKLVDDYLAAPILYGADFEDREGVRRRPWAGVIFYVRD